MNDLGIFKLQKIGVSKINLWVSWTMVVHFRHEFIGVGFANMLKLGVVTP